MDIAPANDAKTTAPQTDAGEEHCSVDARAGLAPGVIAGTEHGHLSETMRNELWLKAGAELAGVTEVELGTALEAIRAKHNFGLESARRSSPKEREAFWRALHLEDLALAQGCAMGREAAWLRFMTLFQGPLTRAAVGMTRSATLGEELAGALYSELYGVTECEGARRSPLENYSGRGSLMGWLRAMLAQRKVDDYRRTHRETELEDNEPAAPEAADPEPETIAHLRAGLQTALKRLAAEERFLLSAYYLDAHTLMELSQVVGVHEATVSRKLKRATKHVRKELVRALGARGLSRRAAEEALGTDPRDIDMNLRELLQGVGNRSYSGMRGRV
jgi:RNA polymerase sigma-70 factor (ECF subfamily)